MEIDLLDLLPPTAGKTIPKSEGKQAKSPSKEVAKDSAKEPSKETELSVFSCVSHPDTRMKFVRTTKTTNLTCKSCGFKIAGQSGYISCTNSKPCQILCSSCKVAR